MKILVLDADANAGRAVVQSLGAAGHSCCVAAGATTGPTFASRWAKWQAVHPRPLVDKPAFQRWVLERQREHRFDLVLPVTEETLMPLHEIRAEAELCGVLAIPPAEAVDVAFDKERLRRCADSVGVPSPDTVFVDRAPVGEPPGDRGGALADPRIDAWLGEGPVVVKSTRSKVWSGPRGRGIPARVLRDRPALERHVGALLGETAVQVQRWVPGHGVGVELLAHEGRIALAFAHDRVHEVPLSGGASSYRRSIAPPPALMAETERLIRALGWHGVAMVEFRVDADGGGHWLMEINGRFWGSLPLAIFAGVDFPRALVDMLATGRAPEPVVPTVGVYARNFSMDVRWVKAVLLDRASDPARLARLLAPSLAEWGRVVTGRETWDGASLRDPGPIVREVGAYLGEEIRLAGRRVDRVVTLRRARTSSQRSVASHPRARRILVLCYGNICRSPYAAARLTERGAPLGVVVRSAGFYPVAGRTTPDEVREPARRRGVDLAAHRSAVVTSGDLAWADLVVIMDEKNKRELDALDAGAAAKTVWLGAFAEGGSVEIDDPYGEPPDAIEAVLTRIDASVANLASALGRDGAGEPPRARGA